MIALRIRSPFMVLVHDLVMIPVAWLVAFWLRFNLGVVPEVYFKGALDHLWLLVLVQGAGFWYFGLYRGVWRFASLPDLMRIAKAVLAGVVISALILFLWTRMEGIPRSIFPLYGILLIGLLGGPRFLYRVMKDRVLRSKKGERVLVLGAGRAGEMLARDLFRQQDSNYLPVGFIDDDPSKLGKEIHGVRVLGSMAKLVEIVRAYEVDVILIATPSAGADQVRRIIELCDQTNVPFRITPRLDDILSGRTRVSELREVSIEDLLGRDQVTLDWKAIAKDLGGRRVMVTGGGGSIGSELCRQIARLAPESLIVVDQSEYNLYSIEMELRAIYPEMTASFHLVDVTDSVAIERVFSTCRPQVVFHAAAYKHVPILQNQVREGVFNNVIGTQRVALAADRFSVESFVLISSDKAVNPSNIMGTTKRIGEIFCQNLNQHSGTRYLTVRFGNVLGSAGSVVPLFTKQIAAGGPVTVTHPDVTRYFMTIPEACQLIMQASANGRGGEIFVLDMGASVKISYLAEQMIRLSGKRPHEDIAISYVGLRPGEKLFEELLHDKESLAATPHQRILLARFREVEWKRLEEVMIRIEKASLEYDEAMLFHCLYELVPECSDPRVVEQSGNKVVPLDTQGTRAYPSQTIQDKP